MDRYKYTKQWGRRGVWVKDFFRYCHFEVSHRNFCNTLCALVALPVTAKNNDYKIFNKKIFIPLNREYCSLWLNKSVRLSHHWVLSFNLLQPVVVVVVCFAFRATFVIFSIILIHSVWGQLVLLFSESIQYFLWI